ncbi:type IV pilin protein [Pseudomonas solani]|uniref:type IV pilin protein n=1 Tax=Pseudomonas solani TaxID=2731552 RepID=UPI003F4AEF8D
MIKQRGVTLIELMVVMVIVAILAGIAYPSYQSYTIRSGRADGMAKLMEIMQAQERFYSQNQSYIAALNGDASASPPTGLGYAATPVPSDEKRYTITAAACGTAAADVIARCVTLTAAPAGPQTKDTECKNLTLNSRGEKGISGTGTVESCW